MSGIIDASKADIAIEKRAYTKAEAPTAEPTPDEEP